MFRTALDGFPLGDVEKDYLLDTIKRFGTLYFVDALGFALMGNHFHLLVRMHPESQYKDREIQKRVNRFFNTNKKIPSSVLSETCSFPVISPTKVSKYREKPSNLSEFMKDIKQCFTRKYNKEKKSRGFFWGQRFKSVIVENGETLINCLAYIDLNPVRANIVEKPEDYRWNTLGYLLQTKNKDNFMTLEFGLPNEKNTKSDKYVSLDIQFYRQFVY